MDEAVGYVAGVESERRKSKAKLCSQSGASLADIKFEIVAESPRDPKPILKKTVKFHTFSTRNESMNRGHVQYIPSIYLHKSRGISITCYQQASAAFSDPSPLFHILSKILRDPPNTKDTPISQLPLLLVSISQPRF